jgi:hypothetical protein
MTNIANILTYWRNCLSDADRMSIDFKRIAQAPRVRPADLAQGRIRPEVFATLTTDQPQPYADKTKPYEPAAAEALNVILCPVVAHRLPIHSQLSSAGDPTIAPLWIPARLAPNGELHPPEDVTPWIARDVLDPTEHPKKVLGAVSALDRFLASHQLPPGDAGWAPYWAYCCSMLAEVTGLSIETCAIDGYALARDTAYIIPADTIQGSRQHVIRLYDRLVQDRQYSALLQSYAAISPAPLRPLMGEDAQRKAAAQHLGQMTADFALSSSQRETMHHFLSLTNGELLAINGPPGTGKTTLIQSIVATLWVDAAIRGAEPPVIVAASTNNQAVTNIIESFGKMASQPTPLSSRWLPDVTSYGLYCVSAHRELPPGKQWQTVLPLSERDNTGFFAGLETPAYVQQATGFFFDHFAVVFQQRVPDLNMAITLLQQRLTATVTELWTGVSLWSDLCTTREHIAERFSHHGGIDGALDACHGQLAEIEAAILRHGQVADSWKQQRQKRSWLARLGFQRKQVTQANRDYINQQRDIPPLSSYADRAVIRALEQRADILAQQKATTIQQREEITQTKQRLQDLEHAWNQWCNAQNTDAMHVQPETLFDTKLRYDTFCLATHYWEARWLVEAQEALSTDRHGLRPQRQQERRWRRYAKITPCFVSTLFMTPRFFSSWENQQSNPLYEYIDLLIVDEAAQVPADVAGATLALAKKAVIVGDTQQIKPVYALTESVDIGNMNRYSVAQTGDQQTVFRNAGLSATRGSFMVAAQRASSYQKSSDMRGMMLLEHRRCLPQIIAYCNELAYHNMLEPKRTLEHDLPLPPMGYAHIPGICTTVRGSRENKLEAEAIVQWVTEQRQTLERHYSKTIQEIVGIVTPFARQAEQIRAALQRHGLSKLTAGTIHTLQGAERRIVIFSPVYSTPGNFFFDQGVNMLNVAVSRAQDSFLVFGNMAIFEPHPVEADRHRRPSSLLARHLFAAQSNELSITVPLHQQTGIQPSTRHLTSLSDHRMALINGFEQARKRIVVVSPYLSEFAIKADRVEKLIVDAVRRGVEVLIYTDRQLDLDPQIQQLKPSAAAARKLLRESGAEVQVLSRVHNKTLCVDDITIVIGSFNWLSAVRDESHRYQRQENSIMYEGPGVSAMIADVVTEMQSRQVTPTESKLFA